MIEIIALSPDNELRVAERLGQLVAAEWPNLQASGPNDRVRIFVGVRALFDVDIVVEISLDRDRPVKACRLRGDVTAPGTSVRSGLLAIEVKQLDRDRYVIQGPEIFPVYGGEPSKRSVGKQIADGVLGLRQLIGRYSSENLFVHGVAWLTDVPDAALDGVPFHIAGHEATWSLLLQSAAARQPILFNAPSDSYRMAIKTVGDVLAIKRFIPPRDRAAVDRLTNATIADGKFEEIKAALGNRQVRLAGRAGSGKSTTIALVADYLARVRQERLLILTYHYALRNEIDRLIRSVVNDDRLVDRYVRVATLVDFLADACDELGTDLPRIEGRLDYQEVEASFRRFLAGASNAERQAEAELLKELEPARFAFDFVCIDEAQDCSDTERDLLRTLFSPECIVLADGMDQLVRRQTPCDWTIGIKAAERLHVDLGRSLRMSQNIARFATAVASEMGLHGWRIQPHPDLSGGRVVILRGGYDRSIFDELLAGLRDGKVPTRDLLVCVPPSEIVMDGAIRDSHVSRALRSWGYEIWNGCSEDVRRSEIARDDQIRIVQYDSMRGLEGWCTMLISLDDLYDYRVRHPNPRRALENRTPMGG